MRGLTVIIMAVLLLSVTLPGCSKAEENVPFSIEVKPERFFDAEPDMASTFAVTVSSEENRKAVNISASVESVEYAYIEVNPKAIKPGQVARVVVYPDFKALGMTLVVNIEGKRDEITENIQAYIEMGHGS